jgi:hypothetical protein
LEIPIILRSLALSIATLNEVDLPLPFDIDFLMTLDSDLSLQNNICQIVEKYECAWWNSTRPWSYDQAKILDNSSLEKCLQAHLKQVETVSISSASASASATSSISANNPSAIHDSARVASATHPPLSDACGRCDELSQILSNTLVDMVKICNFADMMLTSSQAQWNIDMRRASTFNLLYEAAVILETDGSSSATSKKPSATSSATYNKPSAMTSDSTKTTSLKPSPSDKWTWGVRLTKTQVLALARSGLKPKKVIHSGYDLSLLDDSQGGEESSLPSMPKGIFDPNLNEGSLIEEDEAPPDVIIPPSVKFEEIRNRVYDPLGKNRVTPTFLFDVSSNLSGEDKCHVPRLSAQLTEDNLLLHTVNAEKNRLRSEVTMKDTTHSGAFENRLVSASDKSHYELPAERQDYFWDPNLCVEDEWEAEIEVGTENAKLIDDPKVLVKPAATLEVATKTSDKTIDPPATDLDVLWDPSGKSVEDLWEEDEDENDNVEDMQDSGRHLNEGIPPIHIEDEWLSGSDEDLASDNNSNISSKATPNSEMMVSPSRMMVSPSRITLNNPHASFPLSDAWPDLVLNSLQNVNPPNTSLSSSGPSNYRRFTAEDFPNLLDHMFEDKSSDSESSEQEED